LHDVEYAEVGIDPEVAPRGQVAWIERIARQLTLVEVVKSKLSGVEVAKEGG
jgi:hypothetical protein